MNISKTGSPCRACAALGLLTPVLAITKAERACGWLGRSLPGLTVVGSGPPAW